MKQGFFVGKFFKKFGLFCLNAFNHFLYINGLVRASALAYTSLLSLVPLTMVVFGILSAFPAFSSYKEALNRTLLKHFVPASADTIGHYLQDFASQASKLSLLGILFSIITAVMLIYTMEEAFNEIWQIKNKKHRTGLSAFLLYWAIITLLPLALGAAFGASIYLYSLPFVSIAITTIADYFPIFYILPLFISWTSFLFLYMVLPNFKVLFRHAAAGALVAAIFFELIKGLFGFYVTNFSSDFLIYGALAAIPILLVWIYVSWILVLFGAVIAHLLASPPHKIHH